jgi:hypothetical protein
MDHVGARLSSSKRKNSFELDWHGHLRLWPTLKFLIKESWYSNERKFHTDDEKPKIFDF